MKTKEREMKRLFLELYHKPLHTNHDFFFISLIYRDNALNASEKDFSYYFHLGLIWIPLLFSFPLAPFTRNEKEDGTLELYYDSTYCLPFILLLQLIGHWVIQISCVFCAFSMLEFLYQFGRSGMNWLNKLLGSLVFTLLCGIHSRLVLGITSSSGWNSSKNSFTSPTLFPPILFRTSIETEWFHAILLIGSFFLFLSLFPIFVSICLQD